MIPFKPLDFLQDGVAEGKLVQSNRLLEEDLFGKLQFETRPKYMFEEDDGITPMNWHEWSTTYPMFHANDSPSSVPPRETLLNFPIDFSNSPEYSMPWLSGYFSDLNIQAETLLQEVRAYAKISMPHVKETKHTFHLGVELEKKLDSLLLSEDSVPPVYSVLKPTTSQKKVINVALKEPIQFTPTARSFNFELDNFQKAACKTIEESEGNLFIGASTSSGKTVIAEYAIARSLKHLRKAIYTSPIKALSNQKYREFSNFFNHSSDNGTPVDLTTGKSAFQKLTTKINKNENFNRCFFITNALLRLWTE